MTPSPGQTILAVEDDAPPAVDLCDRLSSAGATPAGPARDLSAALRQTGGRVFRIRDTHDDRCRADWSAMNGRIRPEMRDRRAAASVAGSEGRALWPELDVRPEEAVMDKFRFSAFVQGSSDLPDRLRAARP